jgi:CHAD domain-containing protein
VNVERELKLVVPPTFTLPSLLGLLPGVSPKAGEDRWLEAVYLDTADLRLARWGASFRHRSDDGWTVKLSQAGEGDILVRHEYVFPGDDPWTVPPPAQDLVQAFARTSPLTAVAEIGTLRRPVALVGSGGEDLAELTDDDVTVRSGGAVVGRFREIEVEFAEAAPPGLVVAVEARLRGAGAGGAPALPKHLRALGYGAPPAPEIAVPELGPQPTAGDVVHRAIAISVERLIRHDVVVRLDTDPEGVHQARVATRRLRSDLRTFGALVDASWAEPVREGLGWLADMLGGARDTDVMLERIRRFAEELPAVERPGGAVVVAALEQADKEVHDRLLEAMRSDRYAALLEALVTAANQPPLLPEAAEPARDVLPGLVRDPWKHLRREVRAAGKAPPDEVLHQLRIQSKRVRYAAEAVAPALGKPAARFAAAVEDLQEVLGVHQDAVVAEEWLRAWAAAQPSADAAFAAGAIAGRERASDRATRSDWRRAWKHLDTSDLRSWM